MVLRKNGKLVIIVIASIGLFVSLPFITVIFPIRFALNDIPYDDERDFLIVSFQSLHNSWMEDGDRTGLHVNDDGMFIGGYNFVIIEGVDPRKQVSMEIWLTGQNFIVYGTILTDEYVAENYNVSNNTRIIRSTDWDILSPIITFYGVRTGFNQGFLTIYDLRWIDYVFPWDTKWL